MKKLFRQMISLTLICVICISFSFSVLAIGSDNLNGGSETWVDENGNKYELIYTVENKAIDADSHAILYENGNKIQESFVSPQENTVVEYNYNVNIVNRVLNQDKINIERYSYSDLVQSIDSKISDDNLSAEFQGEAVTYSNVPFTKFSTDGGWTLIDKWNASSASPYAVKLYSRNYDDEPDLHPFEKKQLNFAAKVAITTVAGVLAGFVATGGITVAVVVKAFGAAIIKEGTQQVINKSIKGTVCYSTQKIRYAPVVEGYNIYPNAYMTRLWMVAGNAYTGGKSFTKINDAYKYSPQPSTTDLMYAARHYFTDWAQQNGYKK